MLHLMRLFLFLVLTFFSLLPNHHLSVTFSLWLPMSSMRAAAAGQPRHERCDLPRYSPFTAVFLCAHRLCQRRGCRQSLLRGAMTPQPAAASPFVNTLPSLSAQPTSNITWPEVAVAAPLLRSAVCLIGSCHHHIAAARRAENCFWRCAPLYWFSVLSFETTSIKSHIHIHAMLYLRPSRHSWLCAPSTCVAILKR